MLILLRTICFNLFSLMLPNNVKSKIIFFAVIRNLRPSKLFVNYLVINIYLLILGAIALPALAQSGAKSASIKPLLKKWST